VRRNLETSPQVKNQEAEGEDRRAAVDRLRGFLRSVVFPVELQVPSKEVVEEFPKWIPAQLPEL
jgi:hypothetical protein